MSDILNLRTRLLFCLCAALVIGACARDSTIAVPEMARFTLQHDGLEREYFVFLPSAYDGEQQYPVVFFLHGYGGSATGTEAEVTNGLTRYAEEYGYVAVFPQGTWFMSEGAPGERWEVTSWNHISDAFDRGPEGPICKPDADVFPCPPECGNCGQCGWASCNDDAGFLKKLAAHIGREYAVNERRTYISGFSNGAMMAHRMACEASELFAAAALVGGRVEPGFECTPAVPLPLLQINGGEDEIVPFDGRVSASGYFYSSTATTAAFWNFGAECASDTQTWMSPTIEEQVVSCTIACGGSKRESIDCVWPDGDHRWPGTRGVRGSNGYCVTDLQAASMPEQTICVEPDYRQDVWGSRLLFEFFDKHRGEE